LAYLFILSFFVIPAAYFLTSVSIPNSIGIALFLLTLGYLAFLIKVKPDSKLARFLKNAF